MNKEKSERSPAPKRAIAHQDGTVGEDLVRDWLIQQDWQVLYQRWRCRWGELDLIARDGQNTLAFVEVKVRGSGNWDRNGLLAVTPQKQTKLCKAAQLFLAEHAEFLDCFCRFDVALVSHRRRTGAIASTSSAIAIGRPVARGASWLTLEQYLTGAFDAFTE